MSASFKHFFARCSPVAVGEGTLFIDDLPIHGFVVREHAHDRLTEFSAAGRFGAVRFPEPLMKDAYYAHLRDAFDRGGFRMPAFDTKKEAVRWVLRKESEKKD